MNFVYNSCGREKKVIKKTNKDFVKEKGMGKKNRNYNIRILGRDNMPDFA